MSIAQPEPYTVDTVEIGTPEYKRLLQKIAKDPEGWEVRSEFKGHPLGEEFRDHFVLRFVRTIPPKEKGDPGVKVTIYSDLSVPYRLSHGAIHGTTTLQPFVLKPREFQVASYHIRVFCKLLLDGFTFRVSVSGGSQNTDNLGLYFIDVETDHAKEQYRRLSINQQICTHRKTLTSGWVRFND